MDGINKVAESAFGSRANTVRGVAPVARVPERETAPQQQAENRLRINGDPIDKATEALNKALVSQLGSSRLRIDRDEVSGRFVYKTIDNETGEVTQQFPPEELLKALSFYRDFEGLVVDGKA